jgi:hypothetical protein
MMLCVINLLDGYLIGIIHCGNRSGISGLLDVQVVLYESTSTIDILGL